MRKLTVLLQAWLILVAAALPTAAQTDPLPSWNDGAGKAAIVAFVARVTEGPDAVPEPERIAVFDNDGTLWAEQPVYFQLAFAADRAGVTDKAALVAGGEAAAAQLMATTHAGMTTDAFAASVRDWLATARHPRFQRPYTDLAYQPMLELLAHLRARGFKTFIVSGGGIEFMRVFAERLYGIPPEQVVGSSGVTEFRLTDGMPALMKLPKAEFVDDGPGKPVGINRFIGRRPLLAFGNSDGDQQMLQWTAAGPGARFTGLVHHTDATREWAYDRASHIGRLDKALDEARAKGWTVVDMARDWKRVFSFE